MHLKKYLKILLYIVLFLSLAVIGIQVILNIHFNKWIKNQLVASVNNGQAELKIGDLSINIFTGNVLVQRPSFNPLKNPGEAAHYLITASSVKLTGVSIFDYLFNNKVSINGIRFNDAEVSIYQGKELFVADSALSLYDYIKDDFQSLSAKSLIIDDARLNIFRVGNDSVSFLSVDKNDIIIENFLIDSTLASEKKLFKCDSLAVLLEDISWNTESGFYAIRLPVVKASYMDSLLIVEGLSMVPLMNDRDFFAKARTQTDMITISTSTAAFRGADIRRLLETGAVIAENVTLNDLKLEAYRNKNYKRKIEVLPSMQEVLHDLPVDINIDQLSVQNAEIIYKERAEGANRTGRLSFSDMNAEITGVVTGSNKGRMVINATGMLMGKGKMKCNMVFPMSEKKTFYCKGSIGGFDLKNLNPMLEPNTGVAVSEGTLQSIAFDFKADHNYAEGSLDLLYKDLKIELLESDGGTNPVKGLFTFVANLAMIHNANPGNDGQIRKGKILAVRNPQRFIFNYTWKALFSGIEDILKRGNDKNKTKG